MENIDYIIVGDGYAAMFFAHRLIKNDKSFTLFSNGEKGASQISAGIINPVVLKKFTTFWKAQEQIDELKKTLEEIAEYTGKNYLVPEPIHRIFHDENEEKLWLKKTETEELKPFLSKEVYHLENLKNPFGTGKVVQSARLDVAGFFTGLKNYLAERKHLVEEPFDYSELKGDSYKNFNFKKIVFCEGMGVKHNPYFSDIPVHANKGHHITVKFPAGFKLHKTLKKKHFLFPLNEALFYYGGTYDRDSEDFSIDEAAVDQLKNGLREIYPDDFYVSGVNFGFRPTVKDRRPILGSHPRFKNFYVFNGLGARGILNGCFFSEILFNCTENGAVLPPEVDLRRFQ